MSHTAWPTHTDISQVASAMGITLGTAFSSAYITTKIDAIVENFSNRTHRNFIPVQETRYFNGNGRGELEIDDIVTLTSVDIVGWFNITPGLNLDNVHLVERPGYPKNRIQVYQGSVPGLYHMWVDRFPIGRDNIKVVATWGFSSTIPHDVWDAIRLQAAGQIINESNYKSAGFLIKWQEADVTEVRNYMDPFKYFHLPYTYNGIIKLYKKPSGTVFRRQEKQLI